MFALIKCKKRDTIFGKATSLLYDLQFTQFSSQLFSKHGKRHKLSCLFNEIIWVEIKYCLVSIFGVLQLTDYKPLA